MKLRSGKLRRRAFSLMEIMVVLIIIGLVLGLVGPAILGQFESAKKKNAYNQVKLLESCVTSFYLDMNDYPDSLDELVTSPGSSKKWSGPYVQNGVIPKDPWGNDYQYSTGSSRNGISFEIYSYGADGTSGGEGMNADIGNWPDEE